MSARKKHKTFNMEQTNPEQVDGMEDHFVPRKIPSQNVAFRLMMRELHGGSPSGNGLGRDHQGRPVSTTRGFFLNVFPNYTLVNVEKPPCFLRKFTPDGRYFIAFSPCQTHLEVWVKWSFNSTEQSLIYMIEVRNWISILGISEQNNKFDIFVHWFKVLNFFHMTVKGFF